MIRIRFITPEGERLLNAPSESLTIAELLRLHRLPANSVSVYAERGGNLTILTGLHSKIQDLPRSVQSLVVRPDRNISYSAIIERKTRVSTAENACAEYTFASPGAPDSVLHKELTEQECRDFASREVKKFLEAHATSLKAGSKIVLGVSGGGDSNTLIETFLKSGLVRPEQLVCVMMLGIPDWDKGKPRAAELCARFGVELRFVNEHEVNELLGRRKETDWVTDFERTFPDADLEVLGTLAIRLSLKKVAAEVGAVACVVGLNLEDLLAESFLQVMKGEAPLPYPVRVIDGMELWYPLYRCPKKILDGCYPKYSLQNYMDRYPSRMLGRAIPYYLAQMSHAAVPGAEFDLIDGFQKLSAAGSTNLKPDPELGFSTVGGLPLALRAKWRQFQGVSA